MCITIVSSPLIGGPHPTATNAQQQADIGCDNDRILQMAPLVRNEESMAVMKMQLESMQDVMSKDPVKDDEVEEEDHLVHKAQPKDERKEDIASGGCKGKPERMPEEQENNNNN